MRSYRRDIDMDSIVSMSKQFSAFYGSVMTLDWIYLANDEIFQSIIYQTKRYTNIIKITHFKDNTNKITQRNHSDIWFTQHVKHYGYDNKYNTICKTCSDKHYKCVIPWLRKYSFPSYLNVTEDLWMLIWFLKQLCIYTWEFLNALDLSKLLENGAW